MENIHKPQSISYTFVLFYMISCLVKHYNDNHEFIESYGKRMKFKKTVE